ncbi:cysteine-rich venom protein-like isoform X1 [Mixophyes fleayi]|uniref:cysteine-rich venom protein-like isoform X1 n=1 Tax=Mixophyes fleayi TaxID=3061075 RepID=UPI003F4E4182
MLISLLCLSSLLALTAGQANDPIYSLSTDQTSVQNEIIDKINDCRRNVNPPASNMLKVKWNKEAQKNAEDWAKKCMFAHSRRMYRKTSKNYCGENIFLASYPASWEEVITSFYNEHENFVYGKGPATKEDIIYQYTQLVWFNSYEVGCACSHCPNLGYLYVCQHCPEEDFNSLTNPYTAGPKCGDCKNNCDNGLCTNPCPYTNKRYNCPSLKSMCNMDLVKTNCEASCKCTTEII